MSPISAPTDGGGRFRLVMPLRSSDFAGGHVNNVRFQEFSQEAREAWYREHLDIPGSHLPIALVRSVHIDFLAPVLDGALQVWADTEVTAIGTTSFTMRCRIGCDENGPDPVAIVDTVLVNIDADGRPAALTEGERAALAAAVHNSEE